jgi:hypothetical protein
MPYFAGESVSLTALLIASGLGVAAGGLLCLVQRKSWGLDTVLFDALLAPISGIALAYAVLELDKYGSAYFSPAGVVLPVAVASVVVRHLVQYAF